MYTKVANAGVRSGDILETTLLVVVDAANIPRFQMISSLLKFHTNTPQNFKVRLYFQRFDGVLSTIERVKSASSKESFRLGQVANVHSMYGFEAAQIPFVS